MFDKRLVAIGNCPIVDISKETQEKYEGNIIFNPHPVINATNNEVLTHELCHLLAGKRDYDIFKTAIIARDDDERFKWLLNALYDWYHETTGRDYSVIISNNLLSLREAHKIKKQKDPYINKIIHLLNNEVSLSDGSKILEHPVRDVIDLVVIADRFKDKVKAKTKTIVKVLGGGRYGGVYTESKGDYSNYYIHAVSKYYRTIKSLSELWARNKYTWDKAYFGEINWSNLPLLMLGDKINLPVFRLWKKIVMSRNVYVVIDRSGSTYNIKELIMDTAIIIAESLIMSGTPVSILDCGVESDVINEINQPVKYNWFTPMSRNSTPLGKVCDKIKGDDFDSFLLIITDGQPDDWPTLKSALNKFKGEYLTCVIGNDYRRYVTEIGNTIQVEPHTIIRSLLSNENLIIRHH